MTELLQEPRGELGVLPDPKRAIPRQIKADNWTFHVLTRSDDPAIKCQNIGNLVRNIKTTMMFAGLLDSPYPTISPPNTVSHFLEYQIIGANKALNLYSQGKTGYAVECSNAVLESIMFVVYDDRFTETQDHAFGERSAK